MHEILYHLSAESAVLDLGCWVGSFDPASFPFTTVRVDLAPKGAAQTSAEFVQADAVRLPFSSRTFDVVICNHGLEHFRELKPALQEIGRVVKSTGALFVSVPDATTLQDRLYRWLFRGGDHVNLFGNPAVLAKMLSWYSGLPHVATKLLYSSFFFLNRKNLYGALPRKNLRLAAFSFRFEWALSLLTGALRFIDRRFNARTAIYGWAMYFGTIPEAVDLRPWTNVCIRCAQGHPSDWLAQIGAVRRTRVFLRTYRCPNCGACNWYSRDEEFHIRCA